MNKPFIVLLLLLVFAGCSTSKIEKKFERDQFQTIIGQYSKKIEKNTAQENFYVGEAYRKSNRIEASEPFYRAAINQGLENESVHIYLSQSLKAKQKYQEAKQILDDYLEGAQDSIMLERAVFELRGLDNIDTLAQVKNYFRVKNLSDINTKSAEYSPVYENNTLYFVSNRESDRIHKSLGTSFTDIFQVAAKGAKVNLNTLSALPPIINYENSHEGSMTFSKDGQTMIFAKGNTGKIKGADEVYLFFTRFRNGKWSKPKALGINEPKSWNSCPNLSPDGKTLFFASNRPGGYGGTDIYKASLDNRGRWIDVRNMGPKINTPGHEMFPFLAKDGSLYFSSDGHPGYGKQDIHVETRKNGKAVVKNMGRPINSEADDFGIYFFDEIRGFMTSNRAGGKGDDDIYTFVNEDPDLKIINYWLAGTVVTKSEAGLDLIKEAKVFIQDDSLEVLDEAFSTSKGQFRFRVYENEGYQLITEKEGFFTKRTPFTTFGKSVDPSTLTKRINNVTFDIQIELDPIILDKAIVLNNIYYDFDKAEIREDAALELDKLVQILEDNPNISIELGSHTDARADDEYNRDLSDRRARSAVEYIISQGIAERRLESKGYGESELIVKDAKTEEEHQINRRTEFKVIEYDANQKPKEDSEEDFDRFFDSGDEF